MASEFTDFYTAITNAITAWAMATAGAALLAGRTVKVQNEYAPVSTSFPYITIAEKDDTFQGKAHELDAYETFSKNMIEINIYDDAENRVAVVYALKDAINAAAVQFAPNNSPFRFKRIYSSPIPNEADTFIYRWLSRYSNDG